MPRKSEYIPLSEEQDRRIKLTKEQKKKIAGLYATGQYSLKSLAKQFGVSKKTILLIVNPESAAKAKQYRKDNWRRWQKTGKEWNEIQKEHRAYKQKLYKKGKLCLWKKSNKPFYTKGNPYTVTHDNGILNLRWLQEEGRLMTPKKEKAILARNEALRNVPYEEREQWIKNNPLEKWINS